MTSTKKVNQTLSVEWQAMSKRALKVLADAGIKVGAIVTHRNEFTGKVHEYRVSGFRCRVTWNTLEISVEGFLRKADGKLSNRVSLIGYPEDVKAVK